MAKQNTAAGVVEAANQVAAVQNRFIDYGGAFELGVEKVLSKRREQEKAIREKKQQAAKVFETLGTDFDLSGYGLSDNEAQIISGYMIDAKKKLYNLETQRLAISDQTSDEALAIVAQQNQVRTAVKNVAKDVKARMELQTAHQTDANGQNPLLDSYSDACQNYDAITDLYTVTGNEFTGVDEGGHITWENGLTLQNRKQPFTRATSAINTLIKLQEKAVKRKNAYNSSEIDILDQELDAVFDNASVISSILSSDYKWFSNLISPELKAQWDEAVENNKDLEPLKQQFKQLAIDAIQDTAQKTAKVEEGGVDTPSGTKVFEYQSTLDDLIKFPGTSHKTSSTSPDYIYSEKDGKIRFVQTDPTTGEKFNVVLTVEQWKDFVSK